MNTVTIFPTTSHCFSPFRQQSPRQRGITAAIAAFSLASLLGAASLAVDISHLYLAGAELQNAADAAALAGAASLDGTAGGIKAAVDYAVTSMNKYEFGLASVSIDRNNVTFTANLNDFGTNKEYSEATAQQSDKVKRMRFIQVKIKPHQVPIAFASMFLNTQSINLTRTAVAGFSVNGVGEDNQPENISINTICNWVPLCVVQDSNGEPLGLQGACSDTQNFTPGCTYVIKAGSNGNGSGWVSPGNFQCLAPFGDRGGNDLRDNLAMGVNLCIHPGDIIGTEPGNKSGPVRQGLNARFGEYQGNLSYWDAPPDTNIKEGITYAQYRSGLSAYKESSGYPNAVPLRRVIIIPIIEQDEFDHGRDDTIKIHDLAPFFLVNKVPNGQGDIVAEYIGTGFPVGQAYRDPNVNYSGEGRVRVLTAPVLYR